MNWEEMGIKGFDRIIFQFVITWTFLRMWKILQNFFSLNVMNVLTWFHVLVFSLFPVKKNRIKTF